jgi:hypothetical protein
MIETKNGAGTKPRDPHADLWRAFLEADERLESCTLQRGTVMRRKRNRMQPTRETAPATGDHHRPVQGPR